jgi:hypothetical protein
VKYNADFKNTVLHKTKTLARYSPTKIMCASRYISAAVCDNFHEN